MDEQSSSTSARTCEVKNSVLPSALSRRRTDFTATRVAGSRPLIGSSRTRRSRSSRKQEARRSEEHTSELQSRLHLVCRLLLEKKKKNKRTLISGIQE